MSPLIHEIENQPDIIGCLVAKKSRAFYYAIDFSGFLPQCGISDSSETIKITLMHHSRALRRFDFESD